MRLSNSRKTAKNVLCIMDKSQDYKAFVGFFINRLLEFKIEVLKIFSQERLSFFSSFELQRLSYVKGVVTWIFEFTLLSSPRAWLLRLSSELNSFPRRNSPRCIQYVLNFTLLSEVYISLYLPSPQQFLIFPVNWAWNWFCLIVSTTSLTVLGLTFLTKSFAIVSPLSKPIF